MRRRDAAAWIGGLCLALLPPTAATAQAPGADRAKLRAEVVRLRAEVEMLQLDYDLARDELIEDVKLARGLKLAGGLMSALGAAAQPPADDGKKMDAEVAAHVAEKKKELARLAEAVAGKRLDLEDAERRYRVLAPAAATAPIGCISTGNSERVAILEPGAPCCAEPPSEDEILSRLPARLGADRKGARVVVQKIGEKVDPPRDYPLAGRCELIHCHYRATVTLGEPGPDGRPRTEVVFLDKDALRRCEAPAPRDR